MDERRSRLSRLARSWPIPPRIRRSPPRARAQGIEGWVRLEIDVTPAGTVSGARVIGVQPERLFDQAALDAIRRWRFKPAVREGRAVAQTAKLTIRFRLQDR